MARSCFLKKAHFLILKSMHDEVPIITFIKNFIAFLWENQTVLYGVPRKIPNHFVSLMTGLHRYCAGRGMGKCKNFWKFWKLVQEKKFSKVRSPPAFKPYCCLAKPTSSILRPQLRFHMLHEIKSALEPVASRRPTGNTGRNSLFIEKLGIHSSIKRHVTTLGIFVTKSSIFSLHLLVTVVPYREQFCRVIDFLSHPLPPCGTCFLLSP